MDVYKLTGTKKLNTTAYHPTGNGLVENFNKSIQAMIAKHAQTHGPNWDLYLQHLLLAKLHGSTNESPFYLLYVAHAVVDRGCAVPSQSGGLATRQN